MPSALLLKSFYFREIQNPQSKFQIPNTHRINLEIHYFWLNIDGIAKSQKSSHSREGGNP